ncbi:MAG: UDP-glucose 4-epimerase GalE [Desulfovibrionaceae bacterium]|nr:UDP-glucose 4-epimerase GalE [Desulfovibrionaceae bacterium]
MKVLVTGGAGYIGSHTCKHLLRHGHEVVVYDNLSTGFRELARWGLFEHGDMLDAVRLRECLRRHRPDGVIHFAALSQVGESVREPGLYYRVNVGGTLTLLEAMREEGIPLLVMSGTASVYGQADHMPLAESAPTAPGNPYGATKLAMERMLADFERARGPRWISLRYFNAAGADPDGECGEMHTPETHLIPRAFMAAAGAIPRLELFGDDYPTPDGTCVRDYVHVCDLASAHRLALDYLAGGGSGRIFNLGTGTGFSVRQILDAAQKACGRPIPHSVAPRRPGDPAELVADATRAGRELGWTPAHSSLEEIMNTAWRWFTAQSPA